MNRLRVLDYWRAGAVLLVFFFHAQHEVTEAGWAPWEGWWRVAPVGLDLSEALYWTLGLGWIGVPLFFVLSGFCIHLGTLREESGFALRKYAIRRLFRIYPAYLALLVIFSLSDLNPFATRSLFQIGTHLLFIHNFFSSTFFGINPSWWSLAAEVDFYLAYPVLLWILMRWGMGTVLICAVGLLLISKSLVLTQMDWQSSSPVSVDWPLWYSPLGLWFDWVLGAVLAQRYVRGQSFLHWAHLGWLFPLFLLAHLFKPLNAFAFNLASVALAVVLWNSLPPRVRDSVPEMGPQSANLFYKVGLCSYSLFLLHQPLLAYTIRSLREAAPSISPEVLLLTSLLALIPITGLSWIFYQLIERPSHRLGVRLTMQGAKQ